MSIQTKIKTSVRLIYDAKQHCTVVQERNGKTLAVDCPSTGGGQEFSPTNLVAAGLAGCMSLSMGAVALRDNLDLTGMQVLVGISMLKKPETRIGEIAVTVNMPKDFTKTERMKLERAVEACPIKHSFLREIPISLEFHYPNEG